MAGPLRFEDLEAWKKARELVNLVYEMTEEGPLARDFGLRGQIQRAAVSIMSNLAEGYERTHKAEKIQFYKIAKASGAEVRSLSYVLKDRKMAPEDQIDRAGTLAHQVGALIQGLIRSFESREDLK